MYHWFKTRPCEIYQRETTRNPDPEVSARLLSESVGIEDIPVAPFPFCCTVLLDQ